MAHRASLSNDAVTAGLSWESSAITYVAPGIFSIAGVDRTARYTQGTICYIPGMDTYVPVVCAIYDGTKTTVYLADGVGYAGMSIGYLRKAYTLTNACSGGSAVSSGDYNTTYKKDNAFDGSASVPWGSYNNAAPSVFVGYHFAATKKIRWFRILQDTGVYFYPVSALSLQYSDDGTTWTIFGSITCGIPGGWQPAFFGTPAAGHAYWSVAPAVSASLPWGVVELQMGE